jgi:hypothetical protein
MCRTAKAMKELQPGVYRYLVPGKPPEICQGLECAVGLVMRPSTRSEVSPGHRLVAGPRAPEAQRGGSGA